MRFARFLPFLLTSLFVLTGRPVGAEPVPAADEQALKAAGLTPDAAGLIDFFRKRTQGKVARDEIAGLIRQLGDQAAREKAAGQLVGFGQAAVPLLRQAANELDDAEAALRARQCLQHIEGKTGAALTLSAVRALAALKPTGAAELLIAYLPIAEDDSVADEITGALAAVAVRDGKVDPALLKALEDPVAVRRAVAGEVLSQLGGEAARPAVRKLLKDPKPSVRLRAALALAERQDPEAVPVLIGLLADLPQEQARSIDEFLIALAGEWAITVPQGNDDVARKLRRDLWTAWWNATDGDTLLSELKKRTPSDAQREKIQALVANLGAADAATRDKAMAELLALGSAAAPFLRQAANDRDSKASEQAQKALQFIDQSGYSPLPLVAAKLLALRRPAGAAEALLAYLPSAEEEAVAAELRVALAVVAVRDGKADPAVVKALEDKTALRRAAAAEALCQAGADDQKAAVRKLLADADLNVRLRVAMALGGSGDKEAVPVLMALLTELPPAQAVQAEEGLRQLIGDAAPDVSLGDNAASYKKCRDTWEAWWKKNGDKIQLVRLDSRQQTVGYTLVVEQNTPGRNTGRVAEFDRRGNIRWQIENLMYPTDACVIPGGRVLVCEQQNNRVSEWDTKGKMLWQRTMNQPVGVQRLANGNTFIVGRGQIIEIDRNGKEVFNYSRPSFDIACGKKLRNGQIVFVSNQGMAVRLDSNKKELKTVRIPPIQYYNGYIDVLANDHVIVPMYNNNKVVEYDGTGKTVWEASVNLPCSARRLPNGNTLVCSMNPQKVVEIDRNGKVVWETKESIIPLRANRR